MQEHGTSILNQIIENSNGTFKMWLDEYGYLVVSSKGFQYVLTSGGFNLENLIRAHAVITANIGVSEGWIEVREPDSKQTEEG